MIETQAEYMARKGIPKGGRIGTPPTRARFETQAEYAARKTAEAEAAEAKPKRSRKTDDSDEE
jgi:hypothetical protein